VREHKPAEEMKKELDEMLSKLNALEIIAHGEFEKATVKVLRRLVEGQIHSINEFDHLKKAIDLITIELFEVKNKQRSL
jgi:ferritin